MNTSRRRFLRGAGGFALAIPFLETTSTREVRAAGVGPDRFVTWFTSTGTVLARFRPSGLGPGWQASPILAPLDKPELRSQLSVLSGVRNLAAEKIGGNGHSRGITAMLTGRPFKDKFNTGFGDMGWGADISIDQELAARLAKPGQVKSIQAGIQTYGGDHIGYISYGAGGGEVNAIPAEPDPRKLFARLFADVSASTEADEALRRAKEQRLSILDLVNEDFKRLQSRVSRDDRERLDRHLTLVREKEEILRTGGTVSCSPPGAPAVSDQDIYDHAKIPTITDLQMDLVVAAFACGIAPVATVQFSGAQTEMVFKSFVDAPWDQVSCPSGVDTCNGNFNSTAHHVLSHVAPRTEGGAPASPSQAQAVAMTCLAAVQEWYMTKLARFADLLASHVEPDGATLLDRTLTMTVSEVSEGPTHSTTNIPMLLLGGGGTTLRPGHFDFGNDRSMNDVFITVARALGQDMTTFGMPECVHGPIDELLA